MSRLPLPGQPPEAAVGNGAAQMPGHLSAGRQQTGDLLEHAVYGFVILYSLSLKTLP